MKKDGKRFGFTLIELLVVISIIALLLSILMPALSKVKKQARSVVCMSNLKQWTTVFAMYTTDNRESFMPGSAHPITGEWMQWLDILESEYPSVGEQEKKDSFWLCPEAVKSWDEGARGTELAWTLRDVGKSSYGFNGWVYNPPSDVTDMFGIHPTSYNWRKATVSRANSIPMLTDSWWVDAWPGSDDPPPPTIDDTLLVMDDEINRFMVDRHNKHVNTAFLDFSVRKVALKELYTLKWHRNFDPGDIWTLAGGVTSADWESVAPWITNYPDY